MTPKIKQQLKIRDQLITGLEREISLQEKIIREQENTITILEKQLSEYQKLVQEILNS